MDKIIISDGTTSVTMPRTRRVVDAGTPEFREVTMSSGKRVREQIGFRRGYKYEWDDVPAATIASLTAMLRTGQFLTVDYFDPDGTTGSDLFSVSYPSLQVFRFKNGEAVWHRCALTIMAQEVV